MQRGREGAEREGREGLNHSLMSCSHMLCVDACSFHSHSSFRCNWSGFQASQPGSHTRSAPGPGRWEDCCLR